MENEERLFERALERISKAMFALGAGGAIAATAWRGWACGAGFAVGAVASWINFRWLKQIVDALGSKRPTRKRVAVLAGLRYLLLGGGAYVILHYSRISLPAALVGLFVAAGAVIVEILFELVYART
jgi:ATP synthase I chain